MEGPAIGFNGSAVGSGRYPCRIRSAVSRASMASISGFKFDWRFVSVSSSAVVGGFERVWDSPGY